MTKHYTSKMMRSGKNSCLGIRLIEIKNCFEFFNQFISLLNVDYKFSADKDWEQKIISNFFSSLTVYFGTEQRVNLIFVSYHPRTVQKYTHARVWNVLFQKMGSHIILHRGLNVFRILQSRKHFFLSVYCTKAMSKIRIRIKYWKVINY